MYAKRWALLSLCLLVAPASHSAGKAGAAASGEGQATEASSDQALAARIKEALGKEPVLRDAKNLSVMARKGEVTLSGSVENTGQAERAVQVARGVEGVQRVEDKLVRESKLDVPATPHQSTVTSMPRWTTARLTSDTQSSRVACYQSPGRVRSLEGAARPSRNDSTLIETVKEETERELREELKSLPPEEAAVLALLRRRMQRARAAPSRRT